MQEIGTSFRIGFGDNFFFYDDVIKASLDEQKFLYKLWHRTIVHSCDENCYS